MYISIYIRCFPQDRIQYRSGRYDGARRDHIERFVIRGVAKSRKVKVPKISWVARELEDVTSAHAQFIQDIRGSLLNRVEMGVLR